MRIDIFSRLRRLPVLFMASMAVVAGCGEAAREHPSGGSTLGGQEFVSTKNWSGDGSSFSRPVTVKFTGDTAMTWQAACNTAGADVEITANQLIVGAITSTSVGCPNPDMNQDEDLSTFFEGDPRWRINGRHLILQSDSVNVTLRPTDIDDGRGTWP